MAKYVVVGAAEKPPLNLKKGEISSEEEAPPCRAFFRSSVVVDRKRASMGKIKPDVEEKRGLANTFIVISH